MVTVSLCMILKDEEKNISDCLESVADLVDEIIIVDTGSTDNTKEVVKQFTDRIFDFQWIDDFAAARNFSFSKATKDYILWLDADDRLLEADRNKFRELKSGLDPDVDVVMMPYDAGFDSKGNLTLSYYRERMVKRASHFLWNDPVHEYIQPSGVIIHADVHITHCKKEHRNSRRNLEIYQRQLEKGVVFTPRSLLYYALELYYHSYFTEAADKFGEFIDSGEGWVEDNIKATYFLGKTYNCLNEPEKALQAFIKGFQYDLPRAEHCSEIGYIYKSRADYERAAFWFQLALSLIKPQNSWGFFYHDYWGYIPAIELSVCYYKLGNIRKAVEYNEEAGKWKPDDPAVLHNRKFYQSLNYQPTKTEENS